MRTIPKLLTTVVLATVTAVATAVTPFVVQQFKVIGLQRVTLPTVLSYLPIRQGDLLTEKRSDAIIRALYETGFFDNIQLKQHGQHTLVIDVSERPTIGFIHITGNKKIPSKQLQKVLDQLGIREGDVYDKSNLTEITQGLKQEYFNLGRYNAVIDTHIIKEPRNRVGIQVNIIEGPTAKVQKIHIIGNKVFKESVLKKQFKIGTPNLLSFFTHNDEYSEMKLDSDLESLISYYQDHGYYKVRIVSKQVSMSPDHKDIYITINVDAGPQYHINGWHVAGHPLYMDEVQKLITLKPGEVFSLKEITAINNKIMHLYADRGYAKPTINATPGLDENNHTVFLTYHIEQGNRVYVRQIHISGNDRTKEAVLRREMRQYEQSLFNLSEIDESKRRLANLSYLKNITVKPVPVPDAPNQVDLDYHVEEVSAAQASLQAGYSDVDHFLYGASIADPNFLGSGKFAQIGFQHSSYQTNVNLAYSNPYITPWGVSRGFSFGYNKTTPGKVNLLSYAMDNLGGSVNYSFPITEDNYLNTSIGYNFQKIIQDKNSPITVQNFVNQYGTSYNEMQMTAGWIYDDFDRVIMPTKGLSSSLNGELDSELNNHSLNYYKLLYNMRYYHPLTEKEGSGFIFNANLQLAYGNGIGSTKGLPFFENFYAGGLGTVPGVDANSLGPVDPLLTDQTIGGNIMTTGQLNLIFPNFISDTVRSAWVVAGGNVFQNKISFTGEKGFRYSTGLVVSWITPFGPSVEFGLTKLLNKKPGDRPTLFNFTMNATL